MPRTLSPIRRQGRPSWASAVFALAGVVAACAAFSCGAARANQLVTITIPDRRGEIPAKSLTYTGAPRADVLLPDGYNPRKRYPLIVLLPGFSNTYTILGPDMLDAQKVLAGLQAIVVSPEGETGWYTDWFNNGAYGTPEWESYILDEAIPQILGRYNVLPQRRYHALFGVSMGGLGAAYLGGRLPGFFGSIGVLSGFVDPQEGSVLGPLAMDELSGASPGSVVGPGNGFYATGHNPTALVQNLRYTRVLMSAGHGVPTPPDGSGGGVGNAEEAGVIRPMSDAYYSALNAAGIHVTYQTHTGCHCWPDFQAELRNAIVWGPFNPVVEHPTDWLNDTVATHGQIWDIGYRFAAHPNAVVRFTRTGSRLRISAAGTPVTLTTGRGCILRLATPADVQLPTKSCTPARRRHRPPSARSARKLMSGS
jgi:S-formylglutathione hydrolase FrmB